MRLWSVRAGHLITEIAELLGPVLAITGGDPLTRAELFPVIEIASNRCARTSLTLFPTPALELEVISELKTCGLMRAATPGAYRRILELIGEVNTGAVQLSRCGLHS